MWEFLNELIGTLFCLFCVRILIVYMRIHKPRKTIPRASSPTSKVMIILGSGGHTYEMLSIVQKMSNRYRPRIYVIADSDEMSKKKVISLETSTQEGDESQKYEILTIPRSRKVGQSWISSLFTTCYSMIHSIYVLYKHMPDAILCNGPGTCVPLCYAAFLFHVLGMKHIKCLYIESICRVKTMSLSGRLLYPLVDYIFVQWPQLKEVYPRARYLGHLI